MRRSEDASAPPEPPPRPRLSPGVRRVVRGAGVPVLLGVLVTASAPGWGYQVRSGDTLSDIALRYGTTVQSLVRANGLPGHGDLVYAGSTITVPGSGRSTGPTDSTAHERSHLVVAGDTLSEIAARYGVAAGSIAERNSLPPTLIVRLGDTLAIPAAGSSSGAGSASGSGDSSSESGNSFGGRTYPDDVVAAAARNRETLARRGVPSRDRMRDIVVSEANRVGVDPALALAVCWMETGCNHARVSVANAIGVMGVIPATAEWMSTVTGRDLDPLDPVENVQAGVTLLRVLTQQAGERNGIAAYYQGLSSIRSNGMFADTRRYVANILALRDRFG